MKEALHYKKLDNNRVLCQLCPHNCNIGEDGRGLCRVRKNDGGTLYTLNYNKISALSLDPIEKKPLYHFYPGSNILSVGSVGCNLKCSFCQNYHIAQEEDVKTEDITANELVDMARNQENSIGLAFTYNEPSIWFEFVYEAVTISKYYGLKNVLVTNGFINENPLKDILPFVDAMNIDVKGFTEKYYKDVCKGLLEPVKKIVEMAAKQCHIEITTLVVSDLNDSIEEIGQIGYWLSSIDKNIPLHLSRYFPNYKLSNHPTPIGTLIAAKEEAEKYLRYVYIGNVGTEDTSTYCPDCRKAVVNRKGTVSIDCTDDNKCRSCGQKISMIH